MSLLEITNLHVQVAGRKILNGLTLSVDNGQVAAIMGPNGSGKSTLAHVLAGKPGYEVLEGEVRLDGEDLRSRPLEERRDLLESVLTNVPPPIEIAERSEGDSEAVLALAKRRQLEGVIAKRKGSTYEGRRSHEWLKLKVSHAQELAVIGFTPIKNGKREIGALLVGVFDPKKKHYEFAGKVGTGFTTRVRSALFTQLSKDTVDRSPAVDAPRMRDATWVTPKLVAQLQFTEWTRDGKLRHPSFQGLREDKRPEETRRELPVALAEHTSPTAAKRARTSTRAASGERRTRTQLAARTSRTETSRTETAQKKRAAVPVSVTHGTRVVFPGSGITKGEAFEYYRDVSELIVPALEGRPLALKQWPRGIQSPGFFRQNVPDLPDWASAAEVQTAKRPVQHPIIDREETLLWLANHSAFELHMWHSRVPHLTEPDWVVFDLDPGDGPFEDLITVAQALHGLLEKLGLESVPKTSGKRGIHVLVPISRGHNYRDTTEFAVAITGALARALPDIATTERSIKARGGKLYLDAFQNGEGKTIIAPYSLRGVEPAPVSTPLRWSEVTNRLDPSKFNLKTLRKRLDKVGDLFAPALKGKQRLPRFTR